MPIKEIEEKDMQQDVINAVDDCGGQSAFADLIDGVSQPHISRIVNGQDPTSKAVAAFLGRYPKVTRTTKRVYVLIEEAA